TASLSAVDAFHYFGLGQHSAQVAESADPGADLRLDSSSEAKAPEPIWEWKSPALWAILSIGVIGAFNLMGPKHSAGFALFAAAGMIAITLMVVVFALPQIDWRHINLGTWRHQPLKLWEAFVSIVLALSGVEAIANLTGVMKRPVYHTASRAIWVVAIEVAVFNVLLAVCMANIYPLPGDAHKEDMLAFLSKYYTET